jgi:hypothetical protein
MAWEEERRNLNYQPQQAKAVRVKWTEADSFQIAAPLDANRSASSVSFFTSARMTPFGVEDLLVVDSNNHKLHVLVSNNEELKKSGETHARRGAADATERDESTGHRNGGQGKRRDIICGCRARRNF